MNNSWEWQKAGIQVRPSLTDRSGTGVIQSDISCFTCSSDCFSGSLSGLSCLMRRKKIHVVAVSCVCRSHRGRDSLHSWLLLLLLLLINSKLLVSSLINVAAAAQTRITSEQIPAKAHTKESISCNVLIHLCCFGATCYIIEFHLDASSFTREIKTPLKL